MSFKFSKSVVEKSYIEVPAEAFADASSPTTEEAKIWIDANEVEGACYWHGGSQFNPDYFYDQDGVNYESPALGKDCFLFETTLEVPYNGATTTPHAADGLSIICEEYPEGNLLAIALSGVEIINKFSPTPEEHGQEEVTIAGDAPIPPDIGPPITGGATIECVTVNHDNCCLRYETIDGGDTWKITVIPKKSSDPLAAQPQVYLWDDNDQNNPDNPHCTTVEVASNDIPNDPTNVWKTDQSTVPEGVTIISDPKGGAVRICVDTDVIDVTAPFSITWDHIVCNPGTGQFSSATNTLNYIPQPVGNIRVDKIFTEDSVQVGDENVEFTVEFENVGGGDITDIVMTDVLPDGMQYVSDTFPGVTTVSGQNLQFDLASLPAGVASSFTVLVNILELPPSGIFTNFITASGDDGAGGTTSDSGVDTIDGLSCFFEDGDATEADSSAAIQAAIDAGDPVTFTDTNTLINPATWADIESYVQSQGGVFDSDTNKFSGLPNLPVCTVIDKICGYQQKYGHQPGSEWYHTDNIYQGGLVQRIFDPNNQDIEFFADAPNGNYNVGQMNMNSSVPLVPNSQNPASVDSILTINTDLRQPWFDFIDVDGCGLQLPRDVRYFFSIVDFDGTAANPGFVEVISGAKDINNPPYNTSPRVYMTPDPLIPNRWTWDSALGPDQVMTFELDPGVPLVLRVSSNPIDNVGFLAFALFRQPAVKYTQCGVFIRASRSSRASGNETPIPLSEFIEESQIPN